MRIGVIKDIDFVKELKIMNCVKDTFCEDAPEGVIGTEYDGKVKVFLIKGNLDVVKLEKLTYPPVIVICNRDIEKTMKLVNEIYNKFGTDRFYQIVISGPGVVSDYLTSCFKTYPTSQDFNNFVSEVNQLRMLVRRGEVNLKLDSIAKIIEKEIKNFVSLPLPSNKYEVKLFAEIIRGIADKLKSIKVSQMRNNVDKIFDINSVNELNEMKISGFVSHDLEIIPSESEKAFIVGDLHGDLTALFTLLDLTNFWRNVAIGNNVSYIFLGDYIDRGARPINTLLGVLLLKVLFPDVVFVIRGNHDKYEIVDREIKPVVYPHDTLDIYKPMIGNDTFILLKDLMDKLPLGLVSSDGGVFVHGGIPPQSLIEGIKNRTGKKFNLINLFSPYTSSAILNEDPEPENAGRGIFRESDVDYLTKQFGIKYVVRGHSFITEGVRKYWNGKAVTVFSTGFPSLESGYYSAGRIGLLYRKGREFISYVVNSNFDALEKIHEWKYGEYGREKKNIISKSAKYSSLSKDEFSDRCMRLIVVYDSSASMGLKPEVLQYVKNAVNTLWRKLGHNMEFRLMGFRDTAEHGAIVYDSGFLSELDKINSSFGELKFEGGGEEKEDVLGSMLEAFGKIDFENKYFYKVLVLSDARIYNDEIKVKKIKDYLFHNPNIKVYVIGIKSEVFSELSSNQQFEYISLGNTSYDFYKSFFNVNLKNIFEKEVR